MMNDTQSDYFIFLQTCYTLLEGSFLSERKSRKRLQSLFFTFIENKQLLMQITAHK